MIKVDDILHHLVSRSGAPSTMGAQLDRLKYGVSVAPDPFRARDEAESTLLGQARLLRCMSEFSGRQEFRTNYAQLERIQKSASDHPAQGAIALGILRAYQEWSTNSQERALVAVYRYIGQIAPLTVPPPPKNEPDLVQAFRTGKAKRGRSLAAEAYADSLLALGQFLTTWNKAK